MNSKEREEALPLSIWTCANCGYSTTVEIKVCKKCKSIVEKVERGRKELRSEFTTEKSWEVSIQEREFFSELIAKNDPSFFLSTYIAPWLEGEQWERIRIGTLLLLAVSKDLRERSRIHILLQGEPGTGKTDFLLWIRNQLNASFINAELTSKVGLTGFVERNRIVPGLLSDANENILVIDELDKMNHRDQDGLLQSMEEGYYTIVKGKQRERFKAEVRVIACANDLSKIQKPLLDRFDLIFKLKIPSREERARYIEKLAQKFFGKEEPEDNTLRSYLEWIKNFDPKPANFEQSIERIKKWILYTDLKVEERSYRALEFSIFRLAYAYAKLKMEDLKPEHLTQVLSLKEESLQNSTPTNTRRGKSRNNGI